MELFSLLGRLLDKAEFFDDCFDYDVGEDYTSLTYHRKDIEPFAREVLDVYDPVRCNDYDLITVVFNKRNYCKIEELIFGEEKHRVREFVDGMIDNEELEKIYTSMCARIVYCD